MNNNRLLKLSRDTEDALRDYVSAHMKDSHESFEESECLNCIHYCDGCASDYCPGHAVQEDSPSAYDEDSREEEAKAYKEVNMLQHNCGTCVYAVGGVCEKDYTVGEVSSNYSCNEWKERTEREDLA